MENSPVDEELWKKARKRVGFQRTLVTYLVINAMFWIIWYITS